MGLMMRALACAALVAGPAMAAERAVEDIAALLTGQVVDYARAEQVFRADGTTGYAADRPSEGLWEVRGGQYCSLWPPATDWVCYDVLVDGGEIIFRRGAFDTRGRVRP